MNRPIRRALSRSQDLAKPLALLVSAVALVVALLCIGPAAAQDDQPEAPTSETPSKPAAEPTPPETNAPADPNPSTDKDQGWIDALNETLNASLGQVNSIAGGILMRDVSFSAFDYEVVDAATGEKQLVEPEVPFLVIFLGLGAIFFTLWHKFINLRGFTHAWRIVFGKYSDDTDEGDLPPFRALTSALSATVGLGNIASVAVAMVVGGPGALFWMIFLGFFGMCAKFHESTLAQMFRIKNADGTISGGPMFYLDKGLSSIHPSLAGLGKTLAIVFAICCMLAALGGGNMFQANQAFEGFFSTFVQPHVGPGEIDSVRANTGFGFGLVMAVLVGVVVLGGITRIGATTARIVPFMAGIYVLACITIILFHIGDVPALLAEVMTQAFNADAAFGGLIGAMMTGFKRAAFSSESGLGSSAIAHAAAKTDHPVREGYVASLEPFIDTVVICTGLRPNKELGEAAGLHHGRAIQVNDRM
ncbi:MAG: amino acid carrier protein, partial [Phycisphaeraceae bacterium]